MTAKVRPEPTPGQNMVGCLVMIVFGLLALVALVSAVQKGTTTRDETPAGVTCFYNGKGISDPSSYPAGKVVCTDRNSGKIYIGN